MNKHLKVLLVIFGAIITLFLVLLFCFGLFTNALNLEKGLDIIVTGISTLLLSLYNKFSFYKK